jgi:DNA-binding winged helix-turn-helix (wHTH) protein
MGLFFCLEQVQAGGEFSATAAEMNTIAHKSFSRPLIIGDYLFDSKLGLISGPTGSHYICPRLCHALRLLAERAGKAVTERSLVPPGEKSGEVPHDDAVRAVSRLRHYFRDSPVNPSYIEVLPGGGYRLIAPVYRQQATNETQPAAQAADRQPRPNRLIRLVNEFRDRKVCRAMLVYTLVVWLVFQVSEIVVPALGLPDWVNTLVVTLGLLGFPIAATLSWIFDLTPTGLVREHPAPSTPARSSRSRSDYVVDLALIGAAVAVCVALVISSQQANLPLQSGTGPVRESSEVADPARFGGIRFD